jgi:ribosomal protein S18 acetylase RimI-like enzyme
VRKHGPRGMAVTYRRGNAAVPYRTRLTGWLMLLNEGSGANTPDPSPVVATINPGDAMDFRTASATDIPELAILNAALIRDEGHRNRMTVPELEARMRKFFKEGHVAVMFTEAGKTAGYALYRLDDDGVFLRQFYIAERARRSGLGRRAVEWLCANAWQDADRVTLQVLLHNQRGIDFWRAVGFADYCLTMERRPVANA